jgi:CubicO group peptidase (beta-lactamase class C family)
VNAIVHSFLVGVLMALSATIAREQGRLMERKTEIAIRGDAFYINGQPTYAGRSWQGKRIEGLLLNSRMVQGIFDDLNPQTRPRWAYPDTGQWDPERNTREFIAAMPEWRRHGLLAFTLNLQGGSPQGYSQEQPWHNSAIAEDGSLRPDYMARLQRILDRADQLGMAVILGVFYFGQDQRIKDESAVIRALDNAVDWVLARSYRNVLLEVNNECNVRYDHPILQPERVHELIARAKSRRQGGRRLLVGTSYGGGTIPGEKVVRASDFLLLHGNGVSDPERIAQMVRQTRRVAGYRPMPILFNEDDHFHFDRPRSNMTAAIGEYASWGYFDFRMRGEGYDEGYQSVPVNWGLSSLRKRAFFQKVAEITGSPAALRHEVTPGAEWQTRTPEQVGLNVAKLDALRDLVGGRGCVVRGGYLVYAWGDQTHSEDVASAVKPIISMLLMMAVQEGKLRSVDEKVADAEPRLRDLNDGKDAGITWRHLASQTSGYGLSEVPGAAWAYNDYALALYYDTLMEKVFGEDGTQAFKTRIADPLQFQDAFSMEALGENGPRGRLAVSVRDFARIGLLWLRGGRWRDRQILGQELAHLALASPVPANLPRTAGRDAAMLAGQRTLGGSKDQTPVGPGVYSFNWWQNRHGPQGKRLWPDAPPDAFAASGHWGRRMLWIIPSLDLVVSWNDAQMDAQNNAPADPDGKENRAVKLMREAAHQ